MTWQQTIIDHPLLALLVVLPMVGFAALIKVGLVLATGRKPPRDLQPPDPPESGEGR